MPPFHSRWRLCVLINIFWANFRTLLAWLALLPTVATPSTTSTKTRTRRARVKRRWSRATATAGVWR